MLTRSPAIQPRDDCAHRGAGLLDRHATHRAGAIDHDLGDQRARDARIGTRAKADQRGLATAEVGRDAAADARAAAGIAQIDHDVAVQVAAVDGEVDATRHRTNGQTMRRRRQFGLRQQSTHAAAQGEPVLGQQIDHRLVRRLQTALAVARRDGGRQRQAHAAAVPVQPLRHADGQRQGLAGQQVAERDIDQAVVDHADRERAVALGQRLLVAHLGVLLRLDTAAQAALTDHHFHIEQAGALRQRQGVADLDRAVLAVGVVLSQGQRGQQSVDIDAERGGGQGRRCPDDRARRGSLGMHGIIHESPSVGAAGAEALNAAWASSKARTSARNCPGLSRAWSGVMTSSRPSARCTWVRTSIAPGARRGGGDRSAPVSNSAIRASDRPASVHLRMRSRVSRCRRRTRRCACCHAAAPAAPSGCRSARCAAADLLRRPVVPASTGQNQSLIHSWCLNY
jgi:hypothetical protein